MATQMPVTKPVLSAREDNTPQVLTYLPPIFWYTTVLGTQLH